MHPKRRENLFQFGAKKAYHDFLAKEEKQIGIVRSLAEDDTRTEISMEILFTMDGSGSNN